MKAISVCLCIGLVGVLAAAAPVPGATERVSLQRYAADGGVVLAGEYQVPVEEGVEPLDIPAVDAAEGNREASQPSAEAAPPADQPPPADVPPDVEQPSVQP